MILIYITSPSEENAEEISEHLIKKRLIACANIFPIKSIYKWKGNIAKEKEFVIMAKTQEKNFDEVKEEVEKIHPYKIPCILKISAEANQKYSEWVQREIDLSGP